MPVLESLIISYQATEGSYIDELEMRCLHADGTSYTVLGYDEDLTDTEWTTVRIEGGQTVNPGPLPLHFRGYFQKKGWSVGSIQVGPVTLYLRVPLSPSKAQPGPACLSVWMADSWEVSKDGERYYNERDWYEVGPLGDDEGLRGTDTIIPITSRNQFLVLFRRHLKPFIVYGFLVSS